MWKWLDVLFGRSMAGKDESLHADMADELRRNRRQGSDAAALLMVPGIADPGDEALGPGPGASGAGEPGGIDGGSCGGSCGAV